MQNIHHYLSQAISFPKIPDFARNQKFQMITAIALAILLVGVVIYQCIQFLKGRVSKEEEAVDPSTVDKEKPVSFDDLKGIERDLVTITSNNCSIQSFASFNINEHAYHAVGPLSYIQESEKSLAEFMSEVKGMDVVVNLMHEDETKVPFRGQPQSFDTIFHEHLREKGWKREVVNKEVIAYKTDKQEFYRVYGWTDEKDLANTTKVLHFAKVLSQLKVDHLLIHCRRGLQRTATFITIVELMRNNKLAEMDHLTCKKFIYDTLKQLAATANGRVPTSAQLSMLFSDAFIDQVKTQHILKG